jgi:hypothetical protein
MSTARKDLKDMLREGVRQTIQQTLGSVIQEVTEEELRSVLREPSFRGSLVELVRLELEQAIEELRENGKKRRSRLRARLTTPCLDSPCCL